MRNRLVVAAALLGGCAAAGAGDRVDDLCRLSPGRTAAQNALWIENPMSGRFNSARRVVVADIPGPAEITMIHFALPQSHFGEPIRILGRDLLLRMYWDGEDSPSVDCPLVDFFCDPGGLREEVNTALVNKRRGFNAYFPMPFRKSGRVELVYDGPVEPGEALWRIMPCYSYVMYRTLDRVSEDAGYFHAYWRQEGLLLGSRDYRALDARGRGKFVGWNVTVRRPGRGGYPVDMNEKFYIDGDAEASIEFQGIEDSFGFSWGYPPTESQFPLTGYYPFLKGAVGYRFFVNDAIRFDRSLRVDVGFGKREDPMFHRQFSKVGNELQLSSTVYWYQTEPHAPQAPQPPAAERAPAPEDPFWPHTETLPSSDDYRRRGVRLQMLCGRPGKEVVFAEEGYDATAVKGYAFDGWPFPVYHCRAAEDDVRIDVTVPRGAKGMLRLHLIDPDSFQGGRKQSVTVDGAALGTVERFQGGRWIEHRPSEEATADGKLEVRVANARQGSNVVVSIVEWVEAP